MGRGNPQKQARVGCVNLQECKKNPKSRNVADVTCEVSLAHGDVVGAHQGAPLVQHLLRGAGRKVGSAAPDGRAEVCLEGGRVVDHAHGLVLGVKQPLVHLVDGPPLQGQAVLGSDQLPLLEQGHQGGGSLFDFTSRLEQVDA